MCKSPPLFLPSQPLPEPPRQHSPSVPHQAQAPSLRAQSSQQTSPRFLYRSAGVQFSRHFSDVPKHVPDHVWNFETCANFTEIVLKLLNQTYVATDLVRMQGQSEMDRVFCSCSSTSFLLFWQDKFLLQAALTSPSAISKQEQLLG